jgi:vancomycin resistance protein VanJ
MVILIPAALLAITLRQYMLFLCFLLPLSYIIVCNTPHFLVKQATSGPGEQINVMSFNIWSQNTDMEAVCRVIESENPDILFLQEVSQQQLEQLRKHLQSSKKNLLLNISFDSVKLLASLSRFPLIAMESPGTTRTKIQKVKVTSARGDITAFNAHFVRGNKKQRGKDIEEFIKTQIVASQEPVLLVGDLNTTSQTSTYQLLNETLKNSHDEVGRGFGFTYPAGLWVRHNLPLPAVVRIDHIFYSTHFGASAAKTLSQSGGSDHYPVSAQLMFSRP